MGGFGLRSPPTIIQSARLASLTNVSELAHSLGASRRYVQNEASKAISAYMAAVQSDIHPQFTPSKNLQRSLTQPLHQAMLASLINSAVEPTKLRLSSLATPHANSWLSASPYISPMTATEYRAGHLWVGGHVFRNTSSTCPDCSINANPLDIHAVTCYRPKRCQIDPQETTQDRPKKWSEISPKMTLRWRQCGRKVA